MICLISSLTKIPNILLLSFFSLIYHVCLFLCSLSLSSVLNGLKSSLRDNTCHGCFSKEVWKILVVEQSFKICVSILLSHNVFVHNNKWFLNLKTGVTGAGSMASQISTVLDGLVMQKHTFVVYMKHFIILQPLYH